MGCSFTSKCLGLPCAAALFLIIFILYSPDAYRRSIAVLPLALNRLAVTRDGAVDSSKTARNLTDVTTVNPALLRAFPVEVIGWMRLCNKISPLVVLEPTAVQCLDQTASKSCLTSPSSVYRFAVMAEAQLEPGSLLARMASDSAALGWNSSSVGVPARAVVFQKGERIVLVSMLDARPRYWYIHGTQPSDAVQEPPRAFLGLNLTTVDIDDDDDDTLLTPAPADFYLWQWPRSTFVECNRTSAAYLRRVYPENFSPPPKIEDSFLDVLAYCRDMMLKYRMTPMLAGGTGLGWYRECGIIPDTTDMDLMFPATEWKPAFEKALKKDTVLKLFWILGKPDDSLELSVYSRGVKIDLFALYEEGNRSWIGGMIVGEKAKLRWWYPKFDRVCAADLKGHLFYVRCDIVPFLTSDYGPKWYEPHHNANFVWYKSHKNIQRAGNWTLSEWPRVYRTF